MRTLLLKSAAQRFSFGQQITLSDDVVQRMGAHAFGQGLIPCDRARRPLRFGYGRRFRCKKVLVHVVENNVKRIFLF
jgi:hypothetical protein